MENAAKHELDPIQIYVKLCIVYELYSLKEA